MKRERLVNDVLKWLRALIILTALILISYILTFLQPVWALIQPLLWPFVVACIFAYLLHPLIEKGVSVGLSRGVTTILLFFLMMLLFAAALFFGVPSLMSQINEAIDVLPQHLASVKGKIFEFQEKAEQLPHPLQEHVGSWSGRVESFAANGLDQLERLIWSALQSMVIWIVVPFLVFYLLKDYALLKRVGFYVTPARWRDKALLYIKDVDKTFGSYIRGQLLVALCVGVLATIAFWILDVPYPIILGLFVGATDVIPYFGAFIGAIPAVTTALLQSPSLAIYTAVAIFVIQQVEGNILSPLIVGRTVHLHPILIIIALLIGVEAAGVIGLLLAVPVMAIAKVTILHIREYVRGDVKG